MMMLNVVKR